MNHGEARSMARILIFQEHPGELHALRKSLETHHELHFERGIDQALSVLQRRAIDLIIARVHSEQGNVFEFIRTIKRRDCFAEIPLVCFCGRRTPIARKLDPALAKAAETFGADGYICIDPYCSEDTCDFDSLRASIESHLKESASAE